MLQRLSGNLVQTEQAGSQDVEQENRVFAASSGVGDATSSVQELIELARQGDTAAFGELIKRHYSMCLKRACPSSVPSPLTFVTGCPFRFVSLEPEPAAHSKEIVL